MIRSGIYKITSPTGKVYVGQSVNIESRFRQYKSSLANSRSQIALYNSFLRHGTANHSFTIVEECEIKNLNNRERYWQDYYNVLEEGLNCVLQSTTETRRVLSEELKFKISQKLIEIQSCPELRKLKSEITKEHYRKDPERRIRQSEQSKGCKWYTNGVVETLTKEPEEGYVEGRLVKPPTGANHPRSRSLARMDPSTSEVLQTYDVVRQVEEDGYKKAGVVTALYKGILYKGFKWSFLDKLSVE